MTERRGLWLLFVAGFWVTTGALGQSTVPAPPALPLKGYILQDFHTGRVLAASNAELRLEPASITKVMSAYVVYRKLAEGAISDDDRVVISDNAQKQIGSRMFVEAGSKVSVADLLMGVVVQSGNDATVALAEHVAGSEQVFAELMNEQAAELGMVDTHFLNSSGLPEPEHYTTAGDVAVLVQAMIRDFPERYASYSIPSFTYNDIKQDNRNRLLALDPSVDGVKTGHTKSAGYCLAASANRGGMRLISVVLGAENLRDRFEASRQLLDYGYRFFETHKVYAAGQAVTKAPLWKGVADDLDLGLAEDIYVTIPRGSYQSMKASVMVKPTIEAPVQQGEVFGNLSINLNAEELAKPNLVALKDEPAGGVFVRFGDQLMLMFKSLRE